MGHTKILYVDDEAINLELLQLSLQTHYEVLTAVSPKEGLQILARHPDIKLVISDLRMPEMNGLDFIKEVKKANQDIVCMLLTGFMESDVMLEGFKEKLIFRYVMKPWNKQELESSIREALME